MKLNHEIESKIKEKALEDSGKSRPDWKIPHLHAAVFYMKRLIETEGGNPKILLPTIYLHDIGYAGLLQKGYTFEDNKKVKKEHMIVGASNSKIFLNKLGYFSHEEIEQVCKLISLHDNLDEIKGHDAQLVFEADSLAQIDSDKVKPTFNKENYLKFINEFKEKRVPLFKTKTGRDFLNKILPKSENYFD